jgi:hypothetical protein
MEVDEDRDEMASTRQWEELVWFVYLGSGVPGSMFSKWEYVSAQVEEGGPLAVDVNRYSIYSPAERRYT